MSKTKEQILQENAEAAIREAAKEGRIEFADTYLVDTYESEIRVILEKVFDLDIDECFISDESRVWDFLGAGDHNISAEECYETDAWMDWLRTRVFIRLGFPFTGNPTLVTLAEMLKTVNKERDIGSGLN